MLPVANYRLWAKEVNAKGGILIKALDKRIPVEMVEYDDTSNPENAIRLTERLMVDEKVDFALPPWGTAMNLASPRSTRSTAIRSSARPQWSTAQRR